MEATTIQQLDSGVKSFLAPNPPTAMTLKLADYYCGACGWIERKAFRRKPWPTIACPQCGGPARKHQ